MFLEGSIMGFVGAGALMLLHLLMSKTQAAGATRPVRNLPPGARILQGLAHLAGWTVLVAVILLTCTGWSGVWQARPLTGYALMAHVAIGVMFALALAIWVTLTAERYTLAAERHSAAANPAPGWIQRLCFWMMAALSLPLILSIALNLFPLFSQSQQRALAQCHRYSALGFVLAAWSFSYWRWRTEWRKTASLDKPTRKENACHS